MSNLDRMTIEILPDGTLKTVADGVSKPNHANAERFLRAMAELAGGETTTEKRNDPEALKHRHEHEHAEERHHLKH